MIFPHNHSSPKLGYVPSLDGLRAVAVCLVMMLHAHFQWGKNGSLGVDVFFALSGFLITTLLLEEYSQRGSISLRGFYIRRTARLFPALGLLLLVVLVYAFSGLSDQTEVITSEVLWSALYVNNIAWVWGGDSLMLGHTWSLAVEEQFYLVWPWVLLSIIILKNLRFLILTLTMLITLVFLLKISGHFSDFLSSLFHESIFVGCLFALLRWNDWLPRIPILVTACCLATIIVVGVWPVAWYQELFEAGGRGVISLVTMILIIGLVQQPRSILSRVLSTRLLVFTGKISYALYLWHVPVFRWFFWHSTLPPAYSFVLKFVVTFVLAALSWWLLESKVLAWGQRWSKRYSPSIKE